MTLAAWLLGALAIAVIAVHMARPSSNRRYISAARFFRDLPRAEKSSQRWQINNPLSLPMLARLAVLTLLLWALLPWIGAMLQPSRSSGIGLWVLIDTSGSLAAREGLGTRLNTAQIIAAQDVYSALSALATAEDNAFCLRLSTFDQTRIDLLTTRSIDVFAQALASLTPRALATDLSLVRNAVALAAQSGSDECPISHVLVITDQAPLNDLSAESSVPVFWRTVGSPVDNLAITGIAPIRNPLTGLVQSISVDLTAYSNDPPAARFTIRDPAGVSIIDEEVRWQGSPPIRRWRVEFAINQPGRYAMTLTPGGALDFDDSAEIEVPASQVVKIDWQLPDAAWPALPGWELSTQTPHLRIVALADAPRTAQQTSDLTPTLFVGTATQTPNAEQEWPILFFQEGHPLLADLNFDVVEKTPPALSSMPAGLSPVLQADYGAAWLAWRTQPPAAAVPGLPVFDSTESVATTIAFFNGVRTLLGRTTLPPLYSLTDPAQSQPEGTRLALHPGESDTFSIVARYEPLPPLSTRALPAAEQARWPLWLSLAAFLWMIERMLTAWRGERWI